MAEIPALYSQRPIVNRHHKAAMYHPFIEALALTLVDIPMTLVIQAIFAVIVYFLVGLQRTAQQFFIFYLMVVTMTLTMKAFYRALAAAFDKEAGAQAMAGLLTLLLVLYTGYAIPKPTMVQGLSWLTWLSVSNFRHMIDYALTQFNVIASPIRLRGDSIKRVPHYSSPMCWSDPRRSRLRERVAHQSSLYDSRICFWSSQRRRKSLHRFDVRL